MPFVPLPYDSKVSAFIQPVGMEVPDLDDITTGQLLAYIHHRHPFFRFPLFTFRFSARSFGRCAERREARHSG